MYMVLTILWALRTLSCVSDNYAPSAPVPFYFACPLCGDPLEVCLSKKGKPYVTCNACSMQLFVRGLEGIDRFNRLARSSNGEVSRAEVVPRRIEPKRPRGRPRKEPEVGERIRRVAPLGAFGVLTGRST